MHGARRRSADDHDAKWALPLGVILVLVVWLTYIVSVDPTRLPTLPDEAPAAEVAR